MFKSKNGTVLLTDNLTQTTPSLKITQIQQIQPPKQTLNRNPQESIINNLDTDESLSSIQDQRAMKEARIQAMQAKEQVFNAIILKQDKMIRNQLMSVLLFDVQMMFSFKLRTIQHAVKILDVYENKRDELKFPESSKTLCKRKLIYAERSILQIDFITCLFISTKYNEIYPPSLSDLVSTIQNPIRAQVILRNQVRILETLDLNLNIALPSDWYKIMNKTTTMPIWAYLCYLDYDFKDKSRIIAEQITEFIKNFTRKSDPQFSDLGKLHEKFKKSNKMSKNDCTKFYQLFVRFRIKKEVKEMCFQIKNKQTRSKSSRTASLRSNQNIELRL